MQNLSNAIMGLIFNVDQTSSADEMQCTQESDYGGFVAHAGVKFGL